MRGLIRPPLVPLKPNYMPHCQAAGHQITNASVPKMALMPRKISFRMWTCNVQQHSNKVYILGIKSEYTVHHTDSHYGSYFLAWYVLLFDCEWLKITLSIKIGLYVCILNRLHKKDVNAFTESQGSMAHAQATELKSSMTQW